jgi:hypothetical protein
MSQKEITPEIIRSVLLRAKFLEGIRLKKHHILQEEKEKKRSEKDLEKALKQCP